MVARSPMCKQIYKSDKSKTAMEDEVAQGSQSGTETKLAGVKFCFTVTSGQKLKQLPSKSFFLGMDEVFSAIILLQHG